MPVEYGDDVTSRTELDTHTRRHAVTTAQKAVPVRSRPRRDSLESQLLSVYEMALRAGCQEAAAWLKERIET